MFDIYIYICIGVRIDRDTLIYGYPYLYIFNDTNINKYIYTEMPLFTKGFEVGVCPTGKLFRFVRACDAKLYEHMRS